MTSLWWEIAQTVLLLVVTAALIGLTANLALIRDRLGPEFVVCRASPAWCGRSGADGE